ncbi:roadblock/LC7 domain-containing protein [Streptomyces sp. NPDC051315]|uniref:roadblock/LC7 domain-containing protein n=1 Tax=Streptomyces sp. NPDC051315 TaxID=3365650 RepID=UPI0037B22BDB
MAAEPEIHAELRRLRARVPQLTGALAAGVDGLVLAHDTPGVEPEGVSALTATALAVAVRMADTTGQGDVRELLVRGVYGYVATYAAGKGAVLTVLAQDRVNVGRLNLESRRAGARIGELVDAAATPAAGPTGPAARAPSRDPAKTPTTAGTPGTPGSTATPGTTTAAAPSGSARGPRATTSTARTTTTSTTTES